MLLLEDCVVDNDDDGVVVVVVLLLCVVVVVVVGGDDDGDVDGIRCSNFYPLRVVSTINCLEAFNAFKVSGGRTSIPPMVFMVIISNYS